MRCSLSFVRQSKARTVQSLRRIGSMKQILRTRGGQGRTLPHAAILLCFVCIAAGSFFRGAFTSTTSASLGEALTINLIAGVRQVPQEYPTIQAAINAAHYGETVLVSPGIYHERLSIDGKKITVRCVDATGSARIVGNGRIGPIMHVSGLGSTGTKLENLALSAGQGSDGCGLLIEDADVLVRHCSFVSNAGGGVVNIASKSEFFRCEFETNKAQIAGGGFRNEGGSPMLSECVLRSNTAGTFGGGVYSNAGRMTLIKSTISRNATHSGAWGGGIYSGAGELVAIDSVIEKNVSLDSGGGIFVAGGEASLIGCRFLGNYSANGWSVGSSGAVVSMNSSTVCGETATAMMGDGIDKAGAIFVSGCFADRNMNGRDDEEEISLGLVKDCDGNGVPDNRDPDCNSNGIVDRCEIQAGWVRDCNHNGTPDACEILWGIVADIDGDGIIDGCDAE